jgi:hypothetical protein
MIKVSKPGDWIGDLFPEAPTPRQMETWGNIWWRVVLPWIPPRDSRFDFERDFGMTKIDDVLNKKPLKLDTTVKSGGHVLFVFPERWLSTQEEYTFTPDLKENPTIKNSKMTIIDIVTKSPLILGSFIKEDVRIIKSEEK